MFTLLPKNSERATHHVAVKRGNQGLKVRVVDIGGGAVPGAMRLVRQAREGFGLVGAVACGRKGLWLSWCGRSPYWALRPGEVQDDKEQISIKSTIRETQGCDTMVLLPPTCGEMGAFYPVLGQWNEPQSWGTRPDGPNHDVSSSIVRANVSRHVVSSSGPA